MKQKPPSKDARDDAGFACALAATSDKRQSSSHHNAERSGLIKRARQLEWAIKSAVMSTRALFKWGTAWPRLVQPEGCEIPLSINPHDRRARKRLIFDTIKRKYPRNRAFWRDACDSLSPEAAIDVGANFGECLFAPRYAPKTRVFGFEANPELRSHLEDSHSRHPACGQMSVHMGLVGNKHGGKGAFHIDTQWSGMSGATQAIDNPQRYRTLQVPLLSVDGVLEEAQCQPQSVLFKIDVEGYEPRVMTGMMDTLKKAQWTLGFVELDQMSADSAGVHLPSFFNVLKSRFRVYGFNREDQLFDLQDQPFSIFDEIARKKRIASGPGPLYTDLVLVSASSCKEVKDLIQRWQHR